MYTPDPILERLTKAIEFLEAILHSGVERSASPLGHSLAWKGAGVASKAALIQLFADASRSSAPDWLEPFQVDIDRLHRGWSRAEVFDRYGAPTSMRSDHNGVLVVDYAIGLELGRESEYPLIEFHTSDGIVTNVVVAM